MLPTRRRREAYVFAQYFFLSFIYLLVGLGPQSGGYGGPPGIFGDRELGMLGSQAPAGGCRANNVLFICILVISQYLGQLHGPMISLLYDYAMTSRYACHLKG